MSFGSIEEKMEKAKAAKIAGKYFRPLTTDEIIDWGLSNKKIKDLKVGDRLRLVVNNGNSKIADESMGMVFTVHRLLNEPIFAGEGTPAEPHDFTALAFSSMGEVEEYRFNSAEFERVD